MTAEPPETNPDTDSKEDLQQKAGRAETTQKPSNLAGVIASIVWLLLLSVIPSYLMVETIPKLKTILADMLGPGETLPQSTLLVLLISDTIKNNIFPMLVLSAIPVLALLYFMGFKERHIKPTLCKIIDAAFIAFYAGALIFFTIAMTLPFQQYSGPARFGLEAERVLQRLEPSEDIINAVHNGNIAAVKYFLANGANVNEKTSGGSTPLHITIESRYFGREEIVALLLDNGANVNATNSRGWTPAESLKRVAGAMMLVGVTTEVKAANKKIADLLIKHGAKTDSEFKSWVPDKKEE